MYLKTARPDKLPGKTINKQAHRRRASRCLKKACVQSLDRFLQKKYFALTVSVSKNDRFHNKSLVKCFHFKTQFML